MTNIAMTDRPVMTNAESTLDLLLWSRFFSPLIDDAQRADIYTALELGDFASVANDYWGCFHVGNPQPPLPLLLHAALYLQGDDIREDLVRVMEHLQLDWATSPLPPDHLAVVLELLAIAQQQEEPVLQQELCRRWLLPWLQTSLEQIAGDQSTGSVWVPVLQRLRQDLLRGV